jgi:glycosyltransferase involved in cell wall biosynthesis
MSPATMTRTEEITTLSHAGAGRGWVEVVPHLDPKYGGMSAAVPALGEHLSMQEHINISLAGFCLPGEESLPEGYRPERLSYWPISRGAWLTDRLRGNKLHRQLHTLLADSEGVHIHGLWEQSTAIAAATARELGIPYVLSAHGMLEPWALANKRLKKQLYAGLIERRNVAGAACLHALTRAEARHYVNFGARSPIAIIPNGVELPEGAKEDLFLSRFPALRGHRLVLFMARLHPKKGLDLLLEAWADLASRFPGTRLVIAGPDAEATQARCESYVSLHGLGESVIFTGMLRDAMKWSALAAAEIFVLPSYSEGLSVSVLEAMGMGVPVIVTEPCNMPEVAENGAGLEIQPDAGEVASALQAMLSHTPEENAAIGRRGKELVQSRFTWPQVARKMAAVYRWVAGGTKPAFVEFVEPEAR